MLEPLSRADSSHLVQTLLASDVPPQLDTSSIWARETPSSSRSSSVHDRPGPAGIGRRGWTLRGYQRESSSPTSVQALLSARIDLLGADEKAALQAASRSAGPSGPGRSMSCSRRRRLTFASSRTGASFADARVRRSQARPSSCSAPTDTRSAYAGLPRQAEPDSTRSSPPGSSGSAAATCTAAARASLLRGCAA